MYNLSRSSHPRAKPFGADGANYFRPLREMLDKQQGYKLTYWLETMGCQMNSADRRASPPAPLLTPLLLSSLPSPRSILHQPPDSRRRRRPPRAGGGAALLAPASSPPSSPGSPPPLSPPTQRTSRWGPPHPPAS